MGLNSSSENALLVVPAGTRCLWSVLGPLLRFSSFHGDNNISLVISVLISDGVCYAKVNKYNASAKLCGIHCTGYGSYVSLPSSVVQLYLRASSERRIISVPGRSTSHLPRLLSKTHVPSLPSENENVMGMFASLAIEAHPPDKRMAEPTSNHRWSPFIIC